MASEIKQGTLELVNHLPILQVITPMLIAPILVVLNNKTLSWLLSFVGTLACLFISILLYKLLVTAAFSRITLADGCHQSELNTE